MRTEWIYEDANVTKGGFIAWNFLTGMLVGLGTLLLAGLAGCTPAPRMAMAEAPDYLCLSDINRDGTVDMADLLILLDNWGPAPQWDGDIVWRYPNGDFLLYKKNRSARSHGQELYEDVQWAILDKSSR